MFQKSVVTDAYSRGGATGGVAAPLSFAKNEKKRGKRRRKRKEKKKKEGKEEKGRKEEESFTAFTDNLQF